VIHVIAARQRHRVGQHLQGSTGQHGLQQRRRIGDPQHVLAVLENAVSPLVATAMT